MNKLILSGVLGSNPEKRSAQDGNTVTTISLGVKRNYKDKETDWFDIEYWNLSENLQPYLKKGMKLLIEGDLKDDSYEYQGKKIKKLKISGSKLEMLCGPRSEATDNGKTAAKNPITDDDFINDDIPFN